MVVLSVLGALLVEVAMTGEQIDDAVEIGAVPDRNLHRDDLGREVLAHILEHPLEIRMLLVHLGDEKHPGQVQPVADFPCLFGADLHPTHPAQHDHRRIGGIQAGHGLSEEIQKAGSVDEIDLGIQPFGVA
jgi:hypothetical protein